MLRPNVARPWRQLLAQLWLCLSLFTYLPAAGQAAASPDQPATPASAAVERLAQQHGLDPQVVAAMLATGLPPAYINARSAASFVQERAARPATVAPAAAAAPAQPSQPHATPIRVIALVIDGSGSIDPTDFDLQKEGIKLALQDLPLVPRNGTIAVLVIQYAETLARLEVPYRLLASDGDAQQVIAQVGAIVQIQGSTNPGDGINAAAQEIQAHATAADETIICLSTDGLPNAGSAVDVALNSARSAAVPLDSFSVIAMEDPPMNFFAPEFHAFYDPLVFGGGAVSVVKNSAEYASLLGATCFGQQPVDLVGLEVIQTIQDLQDSVQLIAAKESYVRVHAQPVTGDLVRVAARLHGRRNGVELADSPLTALNPASVLDAKPNALARRHQFDQSLNFRLPPAWLNGTVELQVQRVGTPFTCKDAADTPNDCQVSVTFTPMAQPEIRYVTVAWTDTDGTVYQPTAADLAELSARLKAIYPIPALSPSQISESFDRTILFGPNGLYALNLRLKTIRATECPQGCNRLYYGVVRNAPVGGLASEGVASGVMVDGLVFGRNRPAHDLGSLLGRSKAVHSSLPRVPDGNGVNQKQGWCGERDSELAPDFPYSGTVAGLVYATLGPLHLGDNAKIFGLDTNPSHFAVVDPTRNFELMSFCGRASQLNTFRWISKSSYATLVTAINQRFGPAPVQASAVMSQPQTYRLFRGLIHLDTQQVEFLPSVLFTSHAPPQPPAPGDYQLAIKDSAGQVLDTLPFAPTRSQADFPQADLPLGLFTLAVPENPQMARAELLHQAQVVGALAASTHPPTVNLLFPNGGEQLITPTVTLRWQGADADADPLTYLVQHSRDGGATWQTVATDVAGESYTVNLAELGATQQGLFRVAASDGFHGALDASDGPFTAPNQPPQVRITAPRAGDRFAGVQLVFFAGEAQDVEDRALAAANFTWQSSLDGLLGNGPTLLRPATTLSTGSHQITLTVTDTGGLSASATVALVIDRAPPPPPATLVLTPAAATLTANAPNTTTLTVQLKDVAGLPVVGYRVSFYTTLGAVDQSAVTDAAGVAVATLQAAGPPGLATITANAGALTANTAVQFVAGPAAALTLTATPTTVVANGFASSLIRLALQDVYGNPLPGQTVLLDTTLASITIPAPTDADGITTARLSAIRAGQVPVTATVGAVTANLQVTFVAGPPTAVTVVASPPSLPPDGVSTSQITAIVTDAPGNPVANQTVLFATSLGTITPSATTDAAGVASATLTAPTTVGPAQVTATVGALGSSVTVPIQPISGTGKTIYLPLVRR